MPRFFVSQDAICGDMVLLTGENARHLSFSLRARPGDTVSICDGTGMVYECELTAFDGSSVVCRILSRMKNNTEPPYTAVLCQALVKADKMDYIIQKAVELGVSDIIPFESANCVARIKEESRVKKTERWRKIAETAAKQCGRGVIPYVEEPRPFSSLMRSCTDGIRFFCYECGTLPLREKLREARLEKERVYCLVGPEGGFTPAEAEQATASGWEMVSLGNRILRTETASLFFLSALSYEVEKYRSLS